MIDVEDHLLLLNIMLPLLKSLHDGVHLHIIGSLFPDIIKKSFTLIGHWMSLLSEEYTKSVLRGIFLNIKWLF